MKPWSILLVVIAGLTILSLLISRNHSSVAVEFDAAAAPSAAAPQKAPVIVELFTSEGCSSCPPADVVLAELEKKQPVAHATIIALGEHVDYWNYLGWSDPFSAAIYSTRQQDYARALNANVYTPQMVVDGRAEFIGSNAAQAAEAIAKAARVPKAQVQIVRSPPDKIKITATDIPPVTAHDKLDIIVAITENNLQSNVARGENAGRKLRHGTVVRHLQVVGEAPRAETKLTIEQSWNRENLRVVAFLQERMNRRILGATVLEVVEPRP
jgi:hypothetical protein